MIWFFLACTSPGSELGGVSPGAWPPADDDADRPEAGDGCVENRSQSTRHNSLQDAFDAALDGDELVLCEGSLGEGASTALSLSLEGGRILGDLSLGGGRLQGTALEGLVAGTGALELVDVDLVSLRSAGAVTATGGSLGVARLEGPAVLQALHLDSLWTGAELEATELDLSGALVVAAGSARLTGGSVQEASVEGGALTLTELEAGGSLWVGADARLRLEDVLLSDPGAVGIEVEGGSLVVRGGRVQDSSVDTDRVGIRCSSGSLDLQELEISGFSGAMVEAAACDVEVEALTGGGELLLRGGSFLASGLEAAHLQASEEATVDLSEASLEGLTQVGGSLSLGNSTLGGGVGTALDLDGVDAELTELIIEEVDADELRTDLPDGGYTLTSDGGVGIELRDTRLTVDQVELRDMPYGIRASGGSIRGTGLLAWRTWQAAVQVDEGTVVLDGLWVGEGRGWGLYLTDSTLELTDATFTELSMLRRNTYIYSPEGVATSVTTTLSSVPAITASGTEVVLEDAVFLELTGAALEWTGEGQELWLSGAYVDQVDVDGLLLTFAGEGSLATLRELTVRDTRGASVKAVGVGMGELRATDLILSESEGNGLDLSGLVSATVEGLDVSAVDGNGVAVEDLSAFALSDFSVRETGLAGISLEGVLGGVSEGELSRANTAAFVAADSAIALEGVHVWESSVGLRCDTATELDPCTDLAFFSVDTPLDGCPETCEE